MIQMESAEIAKSYLLQWYAHYTVNKILIYNFILVPHFVACSTVKG